MGNKAAAVLGILLVFSVAGAGLFYSQAASASARASIAEQQAVELSAQLADLLQGFSYKSYSGKVRLTITYDSYDIVIGTTEGGMGTVYAHITDITLSGAEFTEISRHNYSDPPYLQVGSVNSASDWADCKKSSGERSLGAICWAIKQTISHIIFRRQFYVVRKLRSIYMSVVFLPVLNTLLSGYPYGAQGKVNLDVH